MKAKLIKSAMYDLHSDPKSLSPIQHFANAKEPITAVCHSPTVLLKATSPTGELLLSSATVTGFSSVEEDQIGMTAAMPFLLEDGLDRVSGGKYVNASNPWGEKVAVSRCVGLGGTLITGQNPASTAGVANEILKALVLCISHYRNAS